MLNQNTQTIQITQSQPYDILVTGATGFIGSRLVSSLVSRGYTVKALSRKPKENNQNLKFVQADLFKMDELEKAMQGVETAYYLVHSMEGDKTQWKQFAARERIQAQNFLQAATKDWC